jgi:hypothetical protein
MGSSLGCPSVPATEPRLRCRPCDLGGAGPITLICRAPRLPKVRCRLTPGTVQPTRRGHAPFLAR